MNSASVGFQCPSCVKEGTRTTRTGRLPYGGLHSTDPRLTSFVLIGLNVLVWLAIQGRSSLAATLALTPRGLCEAGNALASYPAVTDATTCVQRTSGHWIDGVASGAPWQVITSAFTHVEALHIGLNMLALYFLGPALEQVLGRARFLAIYFVAAITGSAGVILFSAPNTPTLGASGAIFGLMGALVVLALKVRGEVRSILMWIGLNLFITFTVPNISWQGHLGGLVGGAVVAAAVVYAPKERRTWIQWGSVIAVSAIAIAVIVVKAHALGGSQVTSISG
jgi:membrane associated rhomboid family serine protease